MLNSMLSRCRSFAAAAALAVVCCGLAACGGGSDSPAAGSSVGVGPNVPGTPATTDGPKAAFVAATTSQAFAPLGFDASASASGDGSALQYVWDFGDGQRGGGAKIAHVFAIAGAKTVTLTVIDTSGRRATQSQGVTVSAVSATGSVLVHVAVVDVNQAAVDGVAITSPDVAAPLATTDALGKADVTLDLGRPLTLRLRKAGYADQVRQVELPSGAGTDTRLDIVLSTRDAPQTLADARAGGSLTGRAGATIQLPADALVDASGALVSGPVDIAMTAVDPTLAGGGGFPGRFDGITPDGTQTPIVSFGTVEFLLGSDANRLQLAPGKTATVELPIMASLKLDGSAVAVGDTIPLWSLDETTGVWIQEGTGTIVANAGAPYGLAMRAVVTHFSWWNSDIGFDPYGPEPQCQYDSDIGIPEARDTFNTATICNMLAEIDRTLSGNPITPFARALVTPKANALSPAIAGYARRAVVPIAGGQPIAVPANTNIALNASALNGTWTGRVVVNGPVFQQDPVIIKMRPLQAIGATAEPISLPVTGLARAIASGQAGRFSFTASELQYAKFQVYGALGSAVSGTARVLQGTTVLASAAFNSLNGNTTVASLLTGLPGAGSYILEIITDQAGSVTINGELLGGVQNETIGFPADVTRSIPSYSAYRASFTLASAATVHFAAQTNIYDAKGEIRLAGSSGNVLWSRSNVGNINPEMIELALPAGSYTLTYSRTDITNSTLRFTSEVTDWLPVADGVAVDDIFSVLDLVADRNGRPVVGVLRHPIVNQTYASSMQLKRFTGTAWENVGGPVQIDLACASHTTSFAFDSSNTPTMVYGVYGNNSSYYVAARRLVAGVWQPIGPNTGVLPQSNSGSGLCDDRYAPRLVIDAADRPIVAYRGDTGVWVQRFDGTSWGKVVPTAQDSFPAIYGGYDLGIAPDGGLWFAQAVDNGGSQPTTVRRLDTGSGAWVTVGPNNGVLPETNTSGFDQLRVKFDATGRPVVAGTIAVGIGVSSRGTAVYRFDGTNWSTTGGYQLPNSYVNYPIAGFAMLGNDALMSWYNQYPQSRAENVVQRNTSSGWSGYGMGVDGTLAAYSAHGATPGRLLSDSRLVVIGNDIYMAGIIPVLSSSSNAAAFNLVLLKKTP